MVRKVVSLCRGTRGVRDPWQLARVEVNGSFEPLLVLLLNDRVAEWSTPSLKLPVLPCMVVIIIWEKCYFSNGYPLMLKLEYINRPRSRL